MYKYVFKISKKCETMFSISLLSQCSKWIRNFFEMLILIYPIRVSLNITYSLVTLRLCHQNRYIALMRINIVIFLNTRKDDSLNKNKILVLYNIDVGLSIINIAFIISEI